MGPMLTTGDVMAGKMLVQLGLGNGEELRSLLHEVDADPGKQRDLIHRLVERGRLKKDEVELIRHRVALYEHVRREAVYLRFLERSLSVDKKTVADLIARLERAAYRRRLGEALVLQGRVTPEQDKALTAQMWDWLAADDERILGRYRKEGFAGIQKPLIPRSRLEPQEFKISTLFRGQETRVLVEKAELQAMRAALGEGPPPTPPPESGRLRGAAEKGGEARHPHRHSRLETPTPPPPTGPGPDGTFPTFSAQPPKPAPAAPGRGVSMEEVVKLKEIAGLQVVELLGQGGMGAVFLAQGRTGEFVAIKVLVEQLAGELPRHRFKREIELLGRVRHPNLIHVIDSGVTPQGLAYLVIPALAGKELREHLQAAGGKGLPAEVVLRVMEQVLSGMSAVHAQRIVHRDLKPENVFVLAGGTWDVRVMDFGLSKLGADAEGVVPPAFKSATDEVAGSPAYISPESVTNDPIDARSDIYSLGIMLFELLTGRLPLESETAQGFLGQHLICPPLTLAEAVPGRPWPAKLEDLIQRMLAKSPAERPQSCDEVLAALRGLREELLAAERQAVAGSSTQDQAKAQAVTLAPAREEGGRWRGLIGKLLGS